MIRQNSFSNVVSGFAICIAIGAASGGCNKAPVSPNETDALTQSGVLDGENTEDAALKLTVADSLTLENVGFRTPESVYHDAANDVYLVTNINGSPTDKDSNGFISKVSPEGAIISLKWIESGRDGVLLNAPKGMVIVNTVLYVADIDVVRTFNSLTGAPIEEIPVVGATFLNDLSASADGAVVYVSDSGMQVGANGIEGNGSDAVYTVMGVKVTPKITGAALQRPNGVLSDADGVWVVTNGGSQLYHVSTEGVQEKSVTLPGGGLDGIVRTNNGRLLISSWETKTVYQGAAGGPFEPLVEGVTSPADIGYDAKRNRLLVPVFLEDKIQLVTLQ